MSRTPDNGPWQFNILIAMGRRDCPSHTQGVMSGSEGSGKNAQPSAKVARSGFLLDVRRFLPTVDGLEGTQNISCSKVRKATGSA